ncbi:MAG: 23S rRNA (pseudouridine(1915)-N(3))-methyltransferase RlmH [Candidatus Zixiibacteriota bacterium]
MLKINILTIGKNKDAWVVDSINHFLKLLQKFSVVNIIYIPEIKNSKNLSEIELKRAEEAAIESYIKSNYKIALTDRGRSYNSVQFSEFLNNLNQSSGGSVDFIVGGIYGLSDKLIKSCHQTLSLSPMTMSHQLIRPVLLEQLYRGFSILAGGKYHK